MTKIPENSEDIDNLPATQELNLVIPPFLPVTRHNSPEEVIDVDVNIANIILNALQVTWGQVKTVSGVCKMTEATLKTIEHRRKMLGHPYGYQGKSAGDGTVDVPE